jgi:pimeloyl-ACP methyl ester carboxylesterase
MASTDNPTIILVHGAFADASGWADVITELNDRDYRCYAPANPLRGVTHDGDYIRSFAGTIDGPVVLVGHSYGGCVITNAGVGSPNVKALVYIAAFAPDEGETLLDTFALGGGSSDLANHLVLRSYPGALDGDSDSYIAADSFHALFCADVDANLALTMEAGQRGFALSCLSLPSGPAAWKTIPSWYMVAADDKTIPPEAERSMAARAGAHTVEVPSSHVAMVSHPRDVAELIVRAALNATSATLATA